MAGAAFISLPVSDTAAAQVARITSGASATDCADAPHSLVAARVQRTAKRQPRG
jgi:hypothetical protein